MPPRIPLISVSTEFPCPECGRKFSSKQDLGKHRKLPHLSRIATTEKKQREKQGAPSSAATTQAGPHSGADRIAIDLLTGNAASLTSPRTGISRDLLDSESRRNGPNSTVYESRPQEGGPGELDQAANDPFLALFEDHDAWEYHCNSNDLSRMVYEFYDGFLDNGTNLFADAHLPSDESRDLPERLKPLFHSCIKRRLSRIGVQEEYRMLEAILSAEPPQSSGAHTLSDRRTCQNTVLSELKRLYPTSKLFSDRVFLERKLIVKDQGWKICTFTSRFNTKQTGVFIPLMDALRNVIAEGGGLSNVVGYKEVLNSGGERLYSQPCDSDAMRKHSLTPNVRSKKKVFFSLYCDGTTLASSGAQSGTVLRIRIDNIPGVSRRWYDVGIAPVLNLEDQQPSLESQKETKLELFQRFLFLLLKSAAVDNPEFENYDFIPVLLSIVCDQPQEREFLALMGVGCEQECSICCVRSLEEKRFQKTRRETLQQNPSRLKRPRTNPPTAGSSSGGLLPPLGGLRHSGSARLFVPPQGGSVTCDTYTPRDVEKTVRTQLEVAVHERLARNQEIPASEKECLTVPGISHCSRRELKQKKDLLSFQGSRKLPSALSVLEGMTNGPKMLYSIAGIDLLHTLYLGPVRQFGDDAFKLFQRPSFASSRQKATLVRVANMRFQEVPHSSGCRGLRPYRLVEKDKQARFTGKQWRDLLPLLWYSVLGLNEMKSPDHDPLFRCALNLDLIHQSLCGVNVSPEESLRTLREIHWIQKRFEKACDDFMSCFGTAESTKLHRLRVHIMDQLRLFGNFRFSDTGVNETLHKGVKKSYVSTNKKIQQIAPQLLQVNVAAEMLENTESLNDTVHQLLLTRDPVLRRSDTDNEAQTVQERQHSNLLEQVKVVEEVELVLDQHAGCSPRELLNRIQHEKDSIRCKMFKLKTKVLISAKFEWLQNTEYSDLRVSQMLHAGAETGTGMPRFDGVLIDSPDGLVYGILERFVQRRNSGLRRGLENTTVALVRKLQRIAPDNGNSVIVREFGYERLAYAIRNGDVELICVPLSAICRRVCIVPDMYDLCCRHSFDCKLSTLPDTSEERISQRFFHAKNVKATSLAEGVPQIDEDDLG